MKVYLAAPYQWKEQIKPHAEELRALGITITSRWLEEPHTPETRPADISPELRQQYAIDDIDDVREADILVLFTDHSKTILRAGRHVEFGVAIGIGLARGRYFPIFVVGEEYENLFHYLPTVEHFPTWESVRDQLHAVQIQFEQMGGNL